MKGKSFAYGQEKLSLYSIKNIFTDTPVDYQRSQGLFQEFFNNYQQPLLVAHNFCKKYNLKYFHHNIIRQKSSTGRVQQEAFNRTRSTGRVQQDAFNKRRSTGGRRRSFTHHSLAILKLVKLINYTTFLVHSFNFLIRHGIY